MAPHDPARGLPEAFRARYEVLQVLGQGASALVFLARRRDPVRTEVVKVLRGDETRFPTMRRRFLQEAALASRLDHPNVVRVLDHGELGGHLYMCFPDVPGATLDRTLALDRIQSIPRVHSMLADILAGLVHVHEVGLVHRDLKPANLLLTLDGDIQILDLGLARDLSEDRGITRTGAFLGTPLYAAPEQVLCETPDPRDDLYAVGVMGYEMLTGDNPFRGTSAADVLDRQLHVRPPLADAARSEVPRSLALWVDRLLAKSREERPASAAVALDELGAMALARDRPTLEDVPEEERCGTRTLGTLEELLAETEADLPEPPIPVPVGAEVSSAPASSAPGSEGEGPPPGGLLPRVLLSCGVAAGLLGALAYGGRSGPMEAPRSRPPRRTAGPALPFPGNAPERALAAIEDVEHWRFLGRGELFRTPGAAPADAFRVAEVDPSFTVPWVDELPGVEEIQRWLREGGDPGELPATLRAALLGVDARYRDVGLPPPFSPAVSTEPVDPGPPAPSLAREIGELRAGLAIPPRVGGWLRAATLAAEEAHGIEAEVVAAIRSGELPPIEVGLSLDALHQVAAPGQRPSRFTRAAMSGLASRVALVRWVEPASRAAERMLYAGARSLREEPATRDLAGLFLMDGLSGVRNVFVGPGAYRPAAQLLAGEPEGAALRAVAAMLEHLQGRVAKWLRRDRGEHAGRRTAHLLAALEELFARPDATPAAVVLEAELLREALDAVAEGGDARRVTLELLARVVTRWERLPPFSRARLALDGVAVLLDLGIDQGAMVERLLLRVRADWTRLDPEGRADLRRQFPSELARALSE